MNTRQQNLDDFATELRQLAYSMPGGYEDPLIRLSERMALYAQQHDGLSTEPSPRAVGS